MAGKQSPDIYGIEEADLVEKIVNLTHAKGEKASRDPWTSVAKARQNRNEKGGTELGLDLLESYLKNGRNINQSQKDRWGGDYPITVLDEALRKVSARIGCISVSDLVKTYPKIDYREQLEDLLLDIGLKQLGYEQIRDKDVDFLPSYGFESKSEFVGVADTPAENASSVCKEKVAAATVNTKQHIVSPNTPPHSSPDSCLGGNNDLPVTPKSPLRSPAMQLGTEKSVKASLKKFTPRGDNRQKVAAIKSEMIELKIAKTPMAFCFLLRSALEISAKEFCVENKIETDKPTKNGGRQDKTLSELLNAVVKKLTDDGKNKGMQKVMYGVQAELVKPDGVLLVTSLNQLVHNSTFSIPVGDICTIFGNIFPLLEAMNS